MVAIRKSTLRSRKPVIDLCYPAGSPTPSTRGRESVHLSLSLHFGSTARCPKGPAQGHDSSDLCTPSLRRTPLLPDTSLRERSWSAQAAVRPDGPEAHRLAAGSQTPGRAVWYPTSQAGKRRLSRGREGFDRRTAKDGRRVQATRAAIHGPATIRSYMKGVNRAVGGSAFRADPTLRSSEYRGERRASHRHPRDSQSLSKDRPPPDSACSTPARTRPPRSLLPQKWSSPSAHLPPRYSPAEPRSAAETRRRSIVAGPIPSFDRDRRS